MIRAAGIGKAKRPTRTHYCYVRYRDLMLPIALAQADTTIAELKRKLVTHQDIGVPEPQQCILRCGAEMLDHQLVSNTSTMLQLVVRKGSSPRPDYQPLPQSSLGLPSIPAGTLATGPNQFFVWCRHSQDDAVRHISIGMDSRQVEYPQELQPASARPRCGRCKSDLVSIEKDSSIRWEHIDSGLIQGICMQCGTSDRIEVVFECRGRLVHPLVSSDGTLRTVCGAISNIPLTNVYRQPPEGALLAQVLSILQRVSKLAPHTIATVLGTGQRKEHFTEICSEASSIANSIERVQHTRIDRIAGVITRAIKAITSCLSQVYALAQPERAEYCAVLDKALEIKYLSSALHQCKQLERVISDQMFISNDTGSQDLIQLEFHGCNSDRPHCINANGLRRYIESQPTVRSILLRNTWLPHVFGHYGVRCFELECSGILYLPSCHLAGIDIYSLIRDWQEREDALAQGAIWCPLPHCRAQLRVSEGHGPCLQCPGCKTDICVEHQSPWHSCPHSAEYVRKRIDEALEEGTRPRCPQCHRQAPRLSSPNSNMTCTYCGQRWCFSCGRHTTDFNRHNRGWESDASKCPRLVTDHPRFKASSVAHSLALVHRSHSLRCLRVARQELDQQCPGRFDAVFMLLPMAEVTIEYRGELGQVAAPAITLDDIRSLDSEDERYR